MHKEAWQTNNYNNNIPSLANRQRWVWAINAGSIWISHNVYQNKLHSYAKYGELKTWEDSQSSLV